MGATTTNLGANHQVSPEGWHYYMLWLVVVSTTRAVTDTTKTVTNSDRSQTDRSLTAPQVRTGLGPKVTDSDRYLGDVGSRARRAFNAEQGHYRSLLSLSSRRPLPEHHLSVSAIRVKGEPVALGAAIGELGLTREEHTDA